MSIRIGLTHRTSYSYDRKITLGPQIVRLRPAPHCRTPIVSYSQTVRPKDHYINWQQDPFGNYLARLVFNEPTDHFSVEIDLVADMVAINPFDFFLDESVDTVPFTYEKDLKRDLKPYLETGIEGDAYKQLVAEARAIWEKGTSSRLRTIDFLVAVNQLVQNRVGYTIRMEPGVQTPEETLTIGTGSCRDSSWLLLNVLREIGLASRFVSGYLVQLKADEKSATGPSGPEEDFTDLHAWVEVYVPGGGWIGLDPTSGLFASEGHIPLAATPEPRSAAAISGALGFAEVEFDFEVKVERLAQPPRITSPVTDKQVRQIEAAGEAINRRLEAGDVRLTMGGEPTFLAGDDRDAGEWTIDAIGPTKRGYADKLIRRYRDAFGPNGLLTFGQGKWYPGEPLPRWAFALYWREDGQPLWHNDKLIQNETDASDFGAEEIETFAKTLTEKLGLDPSYAQPAYEDPAKAILEEHKLPPGIDPANVGVDAADERRKLATVFDEGLSKPKAFILPLEVSDSEDVTRERKSGEHLDWISEVWKTRRDNLFLIPGDSPAGYRLPLASLPPIPSEIASPPVRDPFSPHTALMSVGTPPVMISTGEEDLQKAYAVNEARRRDIDKDEAEKAEADRQKRLTLDKAHRPVRMAMTIEHRDGQIYVFLPPTTSVDAFVDLVSALEETAEATSLPIRIEGYSPPRDPRINEIKVTPDPGVIEVNVHPTSSWKELSKVTRQLYADARALGLEASSFLVNGRPTGSGGGSHIVVGGATPHDSPFLRRPDMLGSIVRFWQNHPSLSYFFAGTFIGPTSQSPRIDEARHDQLYEMNIALEQLPPRGQDVPPWIVDRIFRHLLVDVTGNTHRAEICIDKLYSPDSATGRLGLVEFRAFEMPPHPDMNLAQQLLLRSLISWFWETPYTEPLIPFGTALNDKYMLPEMLWADLKSVLRKTSRATGVHLDPEWFRALYEFRFTKIGQVTVDDVTLELRHALEQWNVLGEENMGGGTSRAVDSSLERVQLEISGDLDGRIVTANGVEIPLTPVGGANRHIAGVRFRSWQPPSCLHPTIAPHSPLVFDIVEPGSGRSVGGCTYFPAHPGGLNPEKRPVNALEAEGRRHAAFLAGGHSAGDLNVQTLPEDARFPMTLDLRRAVPRA